MSKPMKAEVAAPSIRFDVFNIKNFKGSDGMDHAEWRKIGAAFPNGDGKGFNVVLDLVPLDGKLTLRAYEPKADNDDA